MRLHLLTFLLLVVGLANGRVFYLQSIDDNRDTVNPSIPLPDNREQSSRDLDLSFTAGDSLEKENETVLKGVKQKIYTLAAVPERRVVTIGKEIDRPVSYYKLAELSGKRNDREDIIVEPETSRKQLKMSGDKGDGRGDVVVELRVIANHDDA